MRQYLDAKRQHRDAIVFFRMGDFYEMFYEDALTAARVLELTLTSRARDAAGGSIPMCGVPYHAAETYLGRLVKRGYRVAICDQVEDPRKAKGIVKREVTRVISPGTNLDEETLAPERASYLAAVVEKGGAYGFAVSDFSTGELRATELVSDARLDDELRIHMPAEVVLPAGASKELRERIAALLPRCVVSDQPVARTKVAARTDSAPARPEPSSAGTALALAACDVLRAYADVTLEGPIGPTTKASASTGLELRSDGLSSASANLGLSSVF